MRPEPNDDLTTAGATCFARWIERAANLGAEDFLTNAKRRTGKEVVAALGLRRWREGHVRYLQRAYAGGRWHAEMMTKGGA